MKINSKTMNIKVTASTNRLGETTKKVLTEVGKKVGLDEVVVTSTLRTPLAQAEAMLAGSMFGWHVQGADPKSYDENGKLIQQNHHVRGEAR